MLIEPEKNREIRVIRAKKRINIHYIMLTTAVKVFLNSLILIMLAGCATPLTYNLKAKRVEKPIKLPAILRPIGRLDFTPIEESSGLVKSRKYPGVFWTHNDSGDSARIFAVTQNGKIIHPPENIDYQGILVSGAGNVDWEDIAADQKGNLILGDFGNNRNNRRNLTIYIIPEPDPEKEVAVKLKERICFNYPDQLEFPSRQKNFDAEAIFVAHGNIYLLTKHRSDKHTKLYRIDRHAKRRIQTLTLMDVFDIGGLVTAADVSIDGRRLIVLTYNAIWLFDQPDGSEHYFDGSISWSPIYAGQCEAVCFVDDKAVLITNEERQIFEVKLSDLIPLRSLT